MVNRALLPIGRYCQPRMVVKDLSNRVWELESHPLSIPRCKVDHGKHDPDVVCLVWHSRMPQAKVTDDDRTYSSQHPTRQGIKCLPLDMVG